LKTKEGKRDRERIGTQTGVNLMRMIQGLKKKEKVNTRLDVAQQGFSSTSGKKRKSNLLWVKRPQKTIDKKCAKEKKGGVEGQDAMASV